MISIIAISTLAATILAHNEASAANMAMGNFAGRGMQFHGLGGLGGRGLGGFGQNHQGMGMNRAFGNKAVGTKNIAPGSPNARQNYTANSARNPTSRNNAPNQSAGKQASRPSKTASTSSKQSKQIRSASTNAKTGENRSRLVSNNPADLTMRPTPGTIANLGGVPVGGPPPPTQFIGDDPKPGVPKTGEREKPKSKGCSWRIVDITVTSYEKEAKKEKEDEWWKEFMEKAVEKAKEFVKDHAGKKWDVWLQAVEVNISIFRAKAVFLTYACVDEDGTIVDTKVVKLEDEDALYWWVNNTESHNEQTKVILKQAQRLPAPKAQTEEKK